MIPQSVLSTTPIPGPFLAPDNRPREALKDYELAGIAIRDPSQGLQVQEWTFEAKDGGVYASAPSVDETLLFTQAGITALAGAFDQNMNPAVAYVADGQLTFWWFDTVTHTQVFTNFNGAEPRVSLDDKRFLERGTSDVVLSYTRGSNLYCRQQRNRYTIETLLYTGIPEGYTFEQMGMNSLNRLQWYLKPPPEVLPP